MIFFLFSLIDLFIIVDIFVIFFFGYIVFVVVLFNFVFWVVFVFEIVIELLLFFRKDVFKFILVDCFCCLFNRFVFFLLLI